MKRNPHYLVLDIETAPQDNPDKYVLDYFQERKWSKGGVKADREEMDRIIEPTLAQVICICLKSGDDIEKFYQDKDHTEEMIISDFWETIQAVYEQYSKLTLVTFNGLAFDIPFIETRSAILGIGRSVDLPRRKYDFISHFDVRMALTDWDVRGYGDLYFWGHVFKIPIDDEIITSDKVVEYYQKGKIIPVVDHCVQDVTVTEALYLKLTH